MDEAEKEWSDQVMSLKLRVFSSKACTLCEPVKFVARRVAKRLGLQYDEVCAVKPREGDEGGVG